MSNYLMNFKGIGDGKGVLVSLEAFKNVPFEIKRVYYLVDLNADHPRGFHAHKNLKQIVFCLNGSCDFILDNGTDRETIRLDNPYQGIFIESLVWREMHNFSAGCVIMVVASELYDEGDYIRDYSQFKKAVLL